MAVIFCEIHFYLTYMEVYGIPPYGRINTTRPIPCLLLDSPGQSSPLTAAEQDAKSQIGDTNCELRVSECSFSGTNNTYLTLPYLVIIINSMCGDW